MSQDFIDQKRNMALDRKKEEVLSDPILIELRGEWEQGEVIAVSINNDCDRVLTVSRNKSGAYVIMRYSAGQYFGEDKWSAYMDYSNIDYKGIIKWFVDQYNN